MSRTRFAGADFGFRSDSCALAVVEARPGGVVALVALEEQRPRRGAPLRPSVVVSDFADVLALHSIRRVMSDGHYREAIVELLKARSIHLDSAPEGASGKAQTYIHLRTLVNEGRLENPPSREAHRADEGPHCQADQWRRALDQLPAPCGRTWRSRERSRARRMVGQTQSLRAHVRRQLPTEHPRHVSVGRARRVRRPPRRLKRRNTMSNHLINANAVWAAAIEAAIRNAQQQPHHVAAHEAAQRSAAVEAARELGGLASSIQSRRSK